MPVALISTRTSPAFGPSRSSSTISSGFLASKATAARVFMVWSCFASYLASACSLLHAHAGIFCVAIGLGLVFMLRGPHAAECVVGARAQIDVEVVHVAGNVRIVAKGRHDILLRGADILAAAGDDTHEIAVAQRLQRVLQRRRVAR